MWEGLSEEDEGVKREPSDGEAAPARARGRHPLRRGRGRGAPLEAAPPASATKHGAPAPSEALPAAGENEDSDDCPLNVLPAARAVAAAFTAALEADEASDPPSPVSPGADRDLSGLAPVGDRASASTEGPLPPPPTPTDRLAEPTDGEGDRRTPPPLPPPTAWLSQRAPPWLCQTVITFA